MRSRLKTNNLEPSPAALRRPLPPSGRGEDPNSDLSDTIF